MRTVQEALGGNAKMDSIGNPLYASVSSVICSMQAELDTLAQQKAEIERRLGRLRRALRDLRSAKRDAPEERAALSQSPRARRHLRRASKLARAERSQNLYAELRLACRIALLEGEGRATPDQIYASIIRRGSFAFEVLDEEPIGAILRMLDSIDNPREANASPFAVDVHSGSIGMTQA